MVLLKVLAIVIGIIGFNSIQCDIINGKDE